MSEEAPDLESFLTKSFLYIDKVDENIYRSLIGWRPKIARGIFGGQIMGQALMAAANTVPENLQAHSFHCYFLRRGNADRSIIYTVDQTSQGRTYQNRTVKASQGGHTIFTMLASFKSQETDPFSHQAAMPSVPGPEGLLGAKDLIQMALENKDVQLTSVQTRLAMVFLEAEFPCEFRPVDPESFIHLKPLPPRRCMWMRAVGHIGDNMNYHKCAAAYMSDMYLVDVTRMPGPKDPPKSITSLDHSMWFHNPFHANEWMLFEAESPQTGAGKGLAVGRLWRRDGKLAASVIQEGIVRTMAKL